MAKEIVSRPFDGDALELAETIKEMLESCSLEKNIVYFETVGEGNITKLSIQEEKLSDGSIVHNMYGYAE